MKSLSFWARDNKAIARIIIIALQLFLISSAFVLGSLLQFSGSPNIYWIVLAFLMLMGVIFYPGKNQNQKFNPYILQKICDGIIVITSFFLILLTVNYISFQQEVSEPVGSSIIVKNEVQLLSTSKRVSKKNFRKHLKTFIKKLRQRGKSLSTVMQIILIVLVLALAAAACYGIIFLSCSILCSGGGFLGLLVLFGIPAVLFGAAALIDKITDGGLSRGRYKDIRRRRSIIPW